MTGNVYKYSKIDGCLETVFILETCFAAKKASQLNSQTFYDK